MKTIEQRNHSRPAFARFGKIVSAAAFGLLIGVFAIGPVQADEHHGGHDRGRGHEEHWGGHGRGYYGRGPDYSYGYGGYPDYYYAPGPNYYDEPEPYDYGYYPPEPGYYQPGPAEGFREFFGL